MVFVSSQGVVRRGVALLLAYSALFFTVAAAQQTDMTFERLESEAPAAWAKLEQSLSGLDARMNISDVTRAADAEQRRPLETREVRLKLADGRAALESRHSNHSEVWGYNQEYAFRLGGKRDRRDEWDLTYAGKLEVQDNHHVTSDIRYADAMRFLRAPWQVGITPLQDLIASPYFRLVSLRSSTSGATPTVVMQFQFTPPERAAPRTLAELTPLDTPMREGTVTLAPQLQWAITEFDVLSKGGARSRREVVYEGAVDGVPRLRRVVDRLGGTDAAGTRTIRCEVSQWSRRDIPPAEFTLSAYGLPEVVGGRNPFLARVTFVIAAVVALSLGLAAAMHFMGHRTKAN